jgi:hypothetical protein
MVLKVSLSEDQETVINARAAAIGADLKKPISVPDLVRLWIDLGCVIECPAGPAEPPLPVAKSSLFAAMDALAEGQPPEDEDAEQARLIREHQASIVNTPAAAKEAADLAAARAGRQPILKPGEKKK